MFPTKLNSGSNKAFSAISCFFVILGIILLPLIGYSQCPTTNFVISDTVCIGENIRIENNSFGAESYQWDFCSGDLESKPAESFNINSSFFSSVFHFSSIVKEDNVWYVFATSWVNNRFLRIRLTQDLSKVDLIELVTLPAGTLNEPTGVEIIHTKDGWKGLLLNQKSSELIKLSFGSSLANSPSASKVNNTTQLKEPTNIQIIPNNESILSNYEVMVTNGNNATGSLVYLSLGESLEDVLDERLFIISGSQQLRGLGVTKSCDNFYGILSSYANDKVFKLNFGNSLSNVPVVEPVSTNFTFNKPAYVSIVEDNGTYYTFVQSRFGEYYRLHYDESLSSLIDHQNLGKIHNTSNLFANRIIFDETKSKWMSLAIDFSGNTLFASAFPNMCNAVNPIVMGQEPIFSYNSPGKHYIHVKAKDSFGSTSLYSDSVVVKDSPAPQASVGQINDCVSSPITLQAENLTPEQTITSYTWTFPDGTQATGAEVSYQFTDPGTYMLRLDVESENGCGNFFQKEVTVYPEPQAAYSLSANLVCTNAPITFTNETAFEPVSALTYSWDFGDGNTSQELSPKHTYAGPGTYEVLLAASIPGCTSTSRQTITVEAGPQTLFAAEYVCDEERMVFENQTTGDNITAYQWDLGDGTLSSLESPVHIYDAPGAYLVMLQAENELGCATSYTQTVNVYSNPVTDFSIGAACAENPVSFADASSDADGNIVGWRWEFVQPDGSLITSQSSDTTITYPEAGSFEVRLYATTTWGCETMVTKMVKVDPVPQVEIGFEGACVGEPAVLADITDTGELDVQSWYWEVGNEVFTDSAFSYTFQEAGTYRVFLQLNLINGCDIKDSTFLQIDPLPNAEFTYSGACQGQLATFEAAEKASQYFWEIDGTEVAGEGRLFQHVFPAEGLYTVRLRVVDGAGCANVLAREIQVGQPPVAAFRAERIKGVPPFTVDFENQCEGASAYSWSFHDSQESSSNLENPSFTFREIGEYRVEMVAFNEEGCSDTVSQLISVLDPSFDVALNSVHMLQKENGLQLVLGLENVGTILVEDMDIEILINNEYGFSEKFSGILEIGQQENYTLNMQLLEKNMGNVRYICVQLKPALRMVDKEVSQENNKKCLNIVSSFILEEPFPNPSRDQVELTYLLPEKGDVSLELYSAQGKLVQSQELRNQRVGKNQHQLYIDQLGKGIYFLRLRFGGSEQNCRIMKE